MKLGKKPPRHDTRTIRLARYLRATLPSAPSVVTWSKKVNGWSDYANTSIGDCTIAAAGNLIQCWSANGQIKEIELPEWVIVATYAKLSGFDPSDMTTDSGLNELDVLRYWRASGIGGRRIEAFAAVDPHKVDEVKAGIWLFGGLYVGLMLPEAWENQTSTWDVGRGSAYRKGSWGGHAGLIIDYNDRGVVFVTWGGVRFIPWPAWRVYADEAWACIASEFLTDGRAPNGLDVAALRLDLQALRAPV